MKIIALPDIHGDIRNMDRIGAELATVDVVVLAGDITNGVPAELTRVLDAVRAHNDRILAVPGNMDNDRIVAEMEDEGINLHPKNTVIDGVGFMGVGGALPFYGRFVFEEDGLEALCNQAADGIDSSLPQVFICHQPPVNTTTDFVDNMHVGSHSVRAFIERVQPLVCFTGHIHESIGMDDIGQTKIINPGRLWYNGEYAYAEITGKTLSTIEIRHV